MDGEGRCSRRKSGDSVIFFSFWDGNNEIEDVRVFCTKKAESVMSERIHIWKTILLLNGLCGLLRMFLQTVVHCI